MAIKAGQIITNGDVTLLHRLREQDLQPYYREALVAAGLPALAGAVDGRARMGRRVQPTRSRSVRYPPEPARRR